MSSSVAHEATSTAQKSREFLDSETPVRCLNTAKAAYYLGISPSLLRKYRMRGPDDPGGNGPKYIKLSPQLVVYDIKDLDAWLDSFK